MTHDAPPPPGTAPQSLSPQPSLPSVSDSPVAEDRVARAVGQVLVDAWIVAVWFAVAGLVGGFVWWKVTPLAEYTRVGDGGSMDEEQLVHRISSDGWFFVIALVGGLISGIVLVAWRRQRPLAVVVLLVLGGFLAAFVMQKSGLALGPEDPGVGLGKVGEGGRVPLQLKTSADGVLYLWSLGAMVGAVVMLFGSEWRTNQRENPPVLDLTRQYP